MRKKSTTGGVYVLAATDLTFAFQCFRCFWLKVHYGIRQPGTFPAVFQIFDAQQKRHTIGKRTSGIPVIDVPLPSGRVVLTDVRVLSKDIRVPGTNVTIRLRGEIDAVVLLDDGTFGIIDFKTTLGRFAHVGLYFRQLHVYCYCLENPAEGHPLPITDFGLLSFAPAPELVLVPDVGLVSPMTVAWTPVPRNDEVFFEVLGVAAKVLALDSPPRPSPDCSFCKYVTAINSIA